MVSLYNFTQSTINGNKIYENHTIMLTTKTL